MLKRSRLLGVRGIGHTGERHFTFRMPCHSEVFANVLPSSHVAPGIEDNSYVANRGRVIYNVADSC